ncbi:MAG: YajQ family cyclic di-GMP-binding protein [Rickettsiales bacterium]|nr:YajQ family cyclic di-GMP-binding protein [Rickettsiales bacterium]
MPSFDIVCETDLQEVDNMIGNVVREITNRYDFKGSNCTVERAEQTITITADDDYKLGQINELIKTHAVRRQIDPVAFEFKEAERASGNTLRQEIIIKQGIDQENAKKITKEIKASKLKVQASIQGDSLRVNGKKRDDLQEAIAHIKGMGLELPLDFNNFRD